MGLLRSRYLPVLLALTLCGSADGAPLFADEDILDVTLSGPFYRMIKSKRERKEFPFVFNVGGTETKVNIRLRGKSRVRLCKFPPLRLNFDEGRGQESVFLGLDKVKMVTHCKPRNSRAEDSLLNEYLAYRLFNLISEKSYQVRLLRVTYVDTEGKQKGLDRGYHAYLIESESELAQRIGGKILGVNGVPYSRLDPRQTALMNVFHYVIGNSDWSFVIEDDEEACCHNVDLIDVGDTWFPIPYDFDLAGIVGAVYTGSYKMQQTPRRLYSGYCRSTPDSLRAALREVIALRDEILDLAREVPALGRGTVGKRVEYLTEFFDAARDEEALLTKFAKTCLGPR